MTALMVMMTACMPDPDRVLAKYQEDALAHAEAEAAAYGPQWQAGLEAMWSGVRAAIVHVASADADGVYHDLSPELELAWSKRWPGLVPLRTSRSANDTLLILPRPEAVEGGVQISAMLFLGGKWTTHSVLIAQTADGWQAVGEVAITKGSR